MLNNNNLYDTHICALKYNQILACRQINNKISYDKLPNNSILRKIFFYVIRTNVSKKAHIVIDVST